jgi:serine/threonine protein kinase
MRVDTLQATCIKTNKEYAIKAISKLQPDYNERVVQREVCKCHSCHRMLWPTAAELLQLESSPKPCLSVPAVVVQVDLLSRLSAHPNIAGLHELFEDAGHKYIVMVTFSTLAFQQPGGCLTMSLPKHPEQAAGPCLTNPSASHSQELCTGGELFDLIVSR